MTHQLTVRGGEAHRNRGARGSWNVLPELNGSIVGVCDQY